MGKITNAQDRIVVEMLPEEILFRPYYVGESGQAPQFTGEMIGDAIRRIAWKILFQHGKKLIGKRTFKYGDVDVVDGKFVITFADEFLPTSKEPGSA